MHVTLNCEARHFAWRLEERTDIDVKADVGQRGGDHLGAAIMTVLAHLCDEDAGSAPLFTLEFDDHLASFSEFFRIGGAGRVYARDGARDCLVTSPDLFECKRDLAQRGSRARGIYGALQQISIL